MATNSVEYLIKLLPDASELKQKLKAKDVLNFSDISDIKNLIIREIQKATSMVSKEAPKMKNAIQNGLTVDTSKLEEALKFVTGLMEDLKNTGNPMEDWAKRGKGVYDSFTKLQDTVKDLSTTVTTLNNMVDTLSSSFETFKNSYQSFKPTEFANIGKVAKETTGIVVKLDEVFKDLGKDTSGIDKSKNSLEDYKKLLTSISGNKYYIKFETDLDEQLRELNSLLDDADGEIVELQDKISKSPKDTILANELKQVKLYKAQILLQLNDVENERLKMGKKPLLEFETGASLKDIRGELKTILKEFKSDTKKITEGLSKIQLDLTLPEYQSFVPKINKFVDGLNAKSAEFHKINLTAGIIDEALNPIEDKTKRGYKTAKEYRAAQTDVITKDLLEKTGKRFNQLERVITNKQGVILRKTQEWRNKVVEALKIGSKDVAFTYEWKDATTQGAEGLYDALQDYFDSRQIRVQIDKEAFIKDIKDVVESNNFALGSGAGNANVNAILQALEQILAKNGVPIATGQQTTQSSVISSEQETRDKLVELEIAKEKGVVRKLSEATIHIDDVVDALKRFAEKAYKSVETKLPDGTIKKEYSDYSSKASKRAAEVLTNKGVNLEDIRDNKFSQEQLIQILEDVLMKQDDTNQAQGRALGDRLKQIVIENNSSQTSGIGGAIYTLGEEIEKLFDFQDEKTETVTEDTINKIRMELWKKIEPFGKAAGLLKRIRHSKWDKEGNATGYFKVPKIEDIDEAIAQTELVGEDATALKEYREARLQLGDNKDETAMAQFKKAALEFYNDSTSLYKYLSGKFGWFKGEVYIDGRKDPVSINSLRDTALLKGIVSKVIPYEAYGQDYRTNPQLYAKRQNPEQDIRYTPIEYDKFQPKELKELKSNEVDFERGIVSTKQRLEENNVAIQENDAKLQELDVKIKQLEVLVKRRDTAVKAVSRDAVNIDQSSLNQLFDDYNFKKAIISSVQGGKLSSNINYSILPKEEAKRKKEEHFFEVTKGKLLPNLDDVATLYPEIAEQVKQLKITTQHRVELENKLKTLTVEEIKQRLARIKKEETEIKKIEERPKRLRTQDENLRIETFYNSRDNLEKNINFYKAFLADPEGVKKTIGAQIDSYKSAEQGYKEAISGWAKTETGKIPNILSVIQNEIESIITQFRQRVNDLLSEAIEVETKLADPNLSGQKKKELTGVLESILASIKEVETQYGKFTKSFDRKDLLFDETNRNEFDRLTSSLEDQPSVVAERKEKKRQAESELQHAKYLREQAKLMRKELKEEEETQTYSLSRLEKQKEYQALKEKEVQLETEIKKLEEEGASTRKIDNKKKALDEVRSSLSGIANELNNLGVTADELESKPVIQDEEQISRDRKLYALDEVLEYNSQLSNAYKKQEAISDQLEQIQTQRDTISESKFSDRLTTSMLTQYKRELQRQYREKLFKEVGEKYVGYDKHTMSEEMYQQRQADYDNARKKVDEYYDRLIVEKGELLLKNADGATSEIIDQDVKKTLISRIKGIANEEDLKQQVSELDTTIADLREQRKLAMEYGGVNWDDIKNSDIVQEQIPLQSEVAKLTIEKEKAQEELQKLKEQSGDETTKKAVAEKQKEINNLDKQIKEKEKQITELDAKKARRKDEKIAQREAYLAKKEAKQEEISSEQDVSDSNVTPVASQKTSSGAGIKIDSSGIATEKTLNDIYTLLNGGKPILTEDNNKKSKKTTEGAEQVKKEKAKTRTTVNKELPTWIAKMSEEERKKAIASINKYDKETVNKWKQMSSDELIDAMKKITQSMEGLNKESVEYLQKQRELGQILNIYKDKSEFKAQATVSKKNGNTYVDSQKLAQEDSKIKSLGLYDKYVPITSNAVVKQMFETAKQDVSDEQVAKAVNEMAEKTLSIDKRIEALIKSGKPEDVKEAEELKKTSDMLKSQLDSLKTPENKAKKQLNKTKEKSSMSEQQQTSGGIIGLINVLAKEDTLQKILEKIKNGISTTENKSKNTNNLSSKTTASNDDPHAKLVEETQRMEQAVAVAKSEGYLFEGADEGFVKAKKNFDEILQKVKDNKAEAKELEVAYDGVVKASESLNKFITSNKRTPGLNAVKGAIRQRNVIIGSSSDVSINSQEQTSAVKEYNMAYAELIKTYENYIKQNKINDPSIQNSLVQQAAGVQKLGRELLKSTNEAEKLQQAVIDSDTYTDKNGVEKAIGATRMISAEEAKNINSTLQTWAKELYGVDLQNVKVNATTKTLTGTLRVNNTTVKDVAIQYNKATEHAYAFEKAERESLSGFPAFMKGLKEKTKAIAQYLFTMTSIYRIIGEVRKGIQYIKEIDLALVELRKVTDETEETYDKFLETASKTADRLGSTISAVTEATATFAKLGYNIKTATEMAEAAIVYKNVGDNIASTEDAADSIISTLKGFGLEASESMRIVDRFNEVGNRFAITSQGIGEALRLSASALNEGGNTLDESIGIITAANEVVNDPSSVGTALKTLTLRLRGSKTELEEMGEDVSDMAKTTSQLQAKLLALTGGKVDIMLDENTFKSSTQILREMAGAWENMTDIQQAAALELMGGKRQANVLSALITNFDTAEKAIEASAKSAGSAIRENEVYLDSIQGKIDLFTNAVQTMWKNALDSDIVKDIVSLGTWLIKVIDKIGLVKSLLIGIASYSMIKNKMGPIAFFKGIIESSTKGITKVTDYVKGLKNIGATTNELYKATTTLTQAQLKEKLTNTGLTDSVAEEIVAKTNLGKVTDELNASTLDATLREAGYSKEKRESIIQSVFDTQTTKQNTQANQENAQSSQMAGAAEDKDTQDTRENIAATQQDTQATKQNTQANQENAQSTVTLGQRIKNLGKGVGSFIKQNASTFIMLAATILTVGLQHVVDAIVETMDEANEEFEEATNELSSLNSELENLESRLENVNNQIAELIAKTPLSFTDQEELSRLQAQSAELQRQIDLTETLKENQAIKANEEAIQAAKKYENVNIKTGKTTGETVGDTAKTVGGIGIAGTAMATMGAIAGTNAWNVVGWVAAAALAITAIAVGVSAAWAESEGQVGESMDNMKERLETLQGEYNSARINYRNDPTNKKNKEKYEEAQKALNDYKASMSEYMTEMNIYYQTIRDNWDVATEDQKKAAIEWADTMDAYAIASGGQNAKENAINQVFTDGELMGKFKEEKKAIDGYVKALEDGDESAAQSIARVINSNRKLKDAFSAKTLDPQDAIDYFTKIGQEANFATIEGKTEDIRKATEKLGSAFNNIGRFMDGDSVDKVAIAEYFKGTSEATRTEIARLVKNIHDGEITVQQAMKSFAAYGMLESWKIIEAEVSELNTEVFKDLGDDISGIIDTVKELSSAFEDVANSISLVSQAEAEMAYSGHLSVETALQLMESTDDWNKVLEIEEGNIKLVNGAEEVLVQTKLDLIKKNLQTALSTVEAQLAQISATEASADMAYTIEESTNLAVTQLAGNMAYLTEMMTAYTRAASGENVDMSAVTKSAEAAKKAVLDATNYEKNAAEAIGREELEKEKARLEAMLGMYETVNDPSKFKSNYSSDEVSGSNSTKEDAEKSLVENMLDEYERRLALITNERDLIEAEIDKMEAQGGKASAQYYKDLIRNSNEEKSLLQEKKKYLEDYLEANKNSIDSETWSEYNDELNETSIAIKECETNTIEWAEALREIDLHYFEQATDEISRLGEELDFVNGLFEDEEVADENGNWSSAALTRLGIFTQQMEMAAVEAQRYQEEIDKLNVQYKNGELSEEQYQERLSDLVSGQQDAIQSYDEAKDSIVELNEARIDAIRDGIDEEIEAYEDLIDLKKEELDAERDLYDFRKNIKKQTKDIATLERRIASLSGSTAASDIAERRKLQAELNEAREGLNDTYYERSRDQQSQALDDEAEAYRESKEKYIEQLEEQLKDTETLIQNSMMDVLLNADSIYTELNGIADTYGIQLSDKLTQPWEDASAQAILWKNELQESMTSGDYATLIGEGGAITAFANGVATKMKGSWNTAQNAVKGYADYLTGNELGNKFNNTITGFGDQIQTIIDKWNGVRIAAEAAYEAQNRKVTVGGVNNNSGNNNSGNTTSKNTGGSNYNANVAALQAVLNTVFSAGLVVDGKMGGATTTALRTAQSKLGITADGKYGSQTRNAIIGYIDRQVASWRKIGGGSQVGQGIQAYLNARNQLPLQLAKGTMGLKEGQWAITDEPWLGDELVLVPGANGNLSFMRKGTSVVPADITANLIEWGKLNPNTLNVGGGANINMISNAVTKPEFNFDIAEFLHVDHVDKDTMPELERFVDKKMNELVRQLNYSIKKFK